MDLQGWSGKEIASILGVAPTKATQAYAPALDKITKLFMVDPVRTMNAIYLHALSLEPMPPEELRLRVAMLCGRLDKSRMHPKRE